MTSTVSFAVVIPLYNKAAYIEDCLASVLGQSYPLTKVIVVDDGSSDAGPDLVEKHLDSRVQLVRQANAGPGCARNTGIAEVEDMWVSFLDADDLWHHDHLRIHANAILCNPRAGTIGSRHLASANPKVAVKGLSPTEGRAKEVNYVSAAAQRLVSGASGEELLSSSTVSVRRDLLQSVRGFTQAYQGEDTSTWLRLALEAPVVVTDAKTAVYRLETGGTMDSRDDWSQNRILSHPLRLEILKAISASRLKEQKMNLHAYLTAVDANALRGALYHECPLEARLLADVVGVKAVEQLGALRFLLKVNPLLARMVVRGFKLVRKLQKRAIG